MRVGFHIVAGQLRREVAEDQSVRRKLDTAVRAIVVVAARKIDDLLEAGDGITATYDHLGDRATEVGAGIFGIDTNCLAVVGKRLAVIFPSAQTLPRST